MPRERFPEAHLNLAFVLRKQGADYFDEALSHYNRTLELRRRFPEALMYRGVLHTQMGNVDDARADLAELQSMRGRRSRNLAAELLHVIETGKEKEPAQFFGVVRTAR